MRVARWWRPENVPPVPAGDDDSVAEAFLALYAQAVEDRVRVPHPVGVHLSGGLDSSSVAVLPARALQRMGQPAPRFFSWHPPPGDDAPDAAEHALIEAVSRQRESAGLLLSSEHNRRPGLPAPGRDPRRQLPCERIAGAAARGRTGRARTSVRLGRRRERVLRWEGLLSGVAAERKARHVSVREVRETGRHPLAGIMLGAVLPLIAPRRASRPRQTAPGQVAGAAPHLHPPGVCPAGRDCNFRPPPPGRRRTSHATPPAASPAPTPARIDGWAASGARHGIEYRYPLLDRRLLEFALGLPPEQFRRGRWSRWLMRRPLGSVLPAAVQWSRTKQDPVRFRAYHDRFAEALAEARAILDARSTPPSRSPYLDMPRLVRHLDADRFRADPRPGAIARALRFLDF